MGLIVVFGGNDELQDYELAKFTALSSIDYRPQSGRVGVASDASKVGLAPGYFRRLLEVLLNLVKRCYDYRLRATTLETTDDEKTVVTLVTAMKFVDIGAICRILLRLRMVLCR